VTEDAVIRYFSDKGLLSPDECKLIESTRKIRNKILHCEFDSAIELIEVLAGPLPGPSVTMIKLPDNTSGEEILNAVFAGVAAPQKVSDATLKEAGLFGWLLDVTQRGGFKVAVEQFRKALLIIDRVIAETARLDFETANAPGASS
jgi:hypothetical protein